MSWWQFLAGWLTLSMVLAPIVGRWLRHIAATQTSPVEEETP